MMNKILLFAAVFTAATGPFAVPASANTGFVVKDSVEHFMSLGRAEEEARKYSVAWQHYTRAEQLDSCNADIQLAIADVCLKMNRMAPAIRALNNAGELRSADYATRWKLVQLYYHYDQSAKVIALLPELRKYYKDTKDWAFMLGRSYQSLQEYGKALPHMELAVKEDPGHAEALYQTGRIYMLMQNYKAAIPYYNRYLALDSTSNPTRTYELALLLSIVEDYDASLALFQKAMDRGFKPRDDFYMNMANTLADAHKTDQALALLKEMLVRRPGDLGLLNGIAEICYAAKMYPEAIGYWDQVLDIDKNNARTLYSIGTAYIKMGKNAEGQKLCDEAILLEPALAVLKHAR